MRDDSSLPGRQEVICRRIEVSQEEEWFERMPTSVIICSFSISTRWTDWRVSLYWSFQIELGVNSPKRRHTENVPAHVKVYPPTADSRSVIALVSSRCSAHNRPLQAVSSSHRTNMSPTGALHWVLHLLALLFASPAPKPLRKKAPHHQKEAETAPSGSSAHLCHGPVFCSFCASRDHFTCCT